MLTNEQLKQIDSIVEKQVRLKFPIKPFKTKKQQLDEQHFDSQTWDSEYLKAGKKPKKIVDPILREKSLKEWKDKKKMEK